MFEIVGYIGANLINTHTLSVLGTGVMALATTFIANYVTSSQDLSTFTNVKASSSDFILLDKNKPDDIINIAAENCDPTYKPFSEPLVKQPFKPNVSLTKAKQKLRHMINCHFSREKGWRIPDDACLILLLDYASAEKSFEKYEFIISEFKRHGMTTIHNTLMFTAHCSLYLRPMRTDILSLLHQNFGLSDSTIEYFLIQTILDKPNSDSTHYQFLVEITSPNTASARIKRIISESISLKNILLDCGYVRGFLNINKRRGRDSSVLRYFDNYLKTNCLPSTSASEYAKTDLVTTEKDEHIMPTSPRKHKQKL